MIRLTILIFVFSYINATENSLLCKACIAMQEKLLQATQLFGDNTPAVLQKICDLRGKGYFCRYFYKFYITKLLRDRSSYIKDNNLFCSHVLSVCPKKTHEYDFDGFYDRLFKDYPKQENKVKSKPEQPDFNILVINDAHLQIDYKYKSNANCGDGGGCCSDFFPGPKHKEDEAGYWGSPGRNCDPPLYFYDRTLEYIKDNVERPDLIFVLGDNMSHNAFRTDLKYTAESNAYVLLNLKGNFTNSEIVPVLGNHDCGMLDNMDLANQNDYVYTDIYPLFGKLIGKEKVDDLTHDGYFTKEYDRLNLKVISINTQLGDYFNTYLLRNSTNPLNFFDKLAGEVYESEKKGQRVILITHIPIQDSTYSGFERNMNSIILRFKETISGFFSAHTHFDHLKFIKDREGKYVHINYISPSLTTQDVFNPSFRVYKFKDQTLDDYDQYRFNIVKYNKKAENKDYSFSFDRVYSLKTEYGVDKLETVDEIEGFRKSLQEDEEIRKKFILNYLTRYEFDDWKHFKHTALCSIYDNTKDFIKCQNKHLSYTTEEFLYMLYEKLFSGSWYEK